MSGIFITMNGEKYSLDEAEKLGILPKKKENEEAEQQELNEVEIIIDDDTRSFRLSVNGGEAVDIPKSVLIDAFEVSGFSSIKKIIEEDGVDDDTLDFLARSMNLLN